VKKTQVLSNFFDKVDDFYDREVACSSRDTVAATSYPSGTPELTSRF
jgi:hypothetical protein